MALACSTRRVAYATQCYSALRLFLLSYKNRLETQGKRNVFSNGHFAEFCDLKFDRDIVFVVKNSLKIKARILIEVDTNLFI